MRAERDGWALGPIGIGIVADFRPGALSEKFRRGESSAMAKAQPAPSSPSSRLSPREEVILWVTGLLDKLTPGQHRVLLALVTKFNVKRNAYGPGWAIDASWTDVCEAAGVSRGFLSKAMGTLKKFVVVDSGNVQGERNTWIVGGHASSQNELVHEMNQFTKRTSSQNEHKSKEVSTTSEHDPVPVRGGGGPPPAPAPKGTGAPRNSKPPTPKLWPAAQPAPPQRVIDKHARWWSAVVREERAPANGDAEFREISSDPEIAALIEAGLSHVGGWTRIRGTRVRPQDASFARDEFLRYLREHDPAYAKAVESLHAVPAAPKLKAKAARASPG